MKKKGVKFFGYLFFFIINSIFVFSLVLLLLEFGGISEIINKKTSTNLKNLHDTKYYGKKLPNDPYDKFIIQHLHPYYLFSLPNKKEIIDDINNQIISINNEGFRNSYLNENNKKKIILLGGSSAFGHGSSSDKKTISSIISQTTNFNAINRNAPSWNSHQELVALAKYVDKYEISISYSGANDLGIFCGLNLYKNYKKFKDLPESYYRLSSYFMDLRGKPIISTEKKIKQFFIFNFPDTYLIYKLVKKKIKKKKDSSKIKKDFCGPKNSLDILVKKFLENQKAMRELSNGRGAEHILVLQPIYELHLEAKNKIYKGEILSPERILFRKNFTEKIMNSEFCKKNCLDFTNIFDKSYMEDLIFDKTSNEHNFEKHVFMDNVHLLDKGNQIVSKEIKNYLENNF